MDRRVFLTGGLAAWASVPQLTAQTTLQPKTSTGKSLEDLARDWKIPAYSYFYSKADLEQSETFGLTAVPERAELLRVTGDTRFQVASMTKVIVGHLVLQLVDQGLWDLDKSMHDYLPYERAAGDPRAKKITARMLLQHRGGWPNWAKPSQSPEWSTSRLQTQFEPGTQFMYSGEGIYYLQLVAEKLSELPLEKLAEARLFQPLGMHHSSLSWKDGMEFSAVVGHDKSGVPHPRRKFPRSNGAYSMWSTAKDYSIFARQAILGGWGLSPEIHRLFLQDRQPITRARESEKSKALSMGLSVFVMENEAGTSYYHTGTNTGYRSMFIANSDTKEVFVALTNGANGKAWMSKLAALKMTPGQTFWMLQ